MELHCEGEDGYSTPHPERPDRVRAVMARLTASALAGAHPQPTRTVTGSCNRCMICDMRSCRVIPDMVDASSLTLNQGSSECCQERTSRASRIRSRQAV